MRHYPDLCHSGNLCSRSGIRGFGLSGKYLQTDIGKQDTTIENFFFPSQSAVFLLILAIPQIVSTFLVLHQYDVKSGQEAVELAWQANNMDALQQKHECCGKSSAQDYVHLSQLIPPSCYLDLQQTPDHLFLDGCIEKLQSFYESDKMRFIIVSWVLVAFEVGLYRTMFISAFL